MIKIQNSNRGPSGWGKSVLLIIVLVLVVGLAAAPSAQAVPGQQDAALQTLISKAESNGTVRVIIGLDVAFTPEGDLAGVQAAQSQQLAISTAQNQVWQQIAGYNSELESRFKYIPAMALSVDAAALDKLSSLPQVTYIQEDKLSAPSLASSVPVIGADNAWAAGYTGSGQTIAILDTGVDKTHSFFQGGKVVSEACFSTIYAPYGSTTVCPSGAEFQIGPGAGIDCTAKVSGAAVSDCAHGTHVAGIAAGNNGGANIGVAKDAQIIAIQVFSYFTGGIICDSCARTYNSDQIEGLERVYDLRNDYNIAAVNMSLGSSTQYTSACDDVEATRKAAIDNLRSVGIPTIIATGNGDSTYGIGYRDSMSAPACISSAISVGSTEDDDDVSTFSNIASFMDLLAPGTSITSSVPGESLGTWNGTSMATPHVAGAWAVIKSFVPNATIDEVLAALKSTGTLIDDNRPAMVIPPRPAGSVQDIPRINVDLAINSFNDPPVAVNDGVPTPLNTAVTVNVLLNDSDPNNDPLTITTVGTAAHGTAVKASSTNIQYTPTTGYSGADSFTYTISDGNGGSDTGTVFVIVDGQSVFLPIVLKN